MDQLICETLKQRYSVQSVLGHQDGRRTFLAKDQAKQQQVVIKLLLFGPGFSWEQLKLFEREAATLKSIQHSAIPSYLDYFDVETPAGKGFALVQSYIEARSLQEWVDQGRIFSEKELHDIAEQLLDILDYLHGQQPAIIHRDIKPSNILLADNRSAHSVGTLYLVDFGAVQGTPHLGTFTVVGTYGYMPIEQFGGKTEPASDLYSLGATLLYLMNRIHPAELPRKRGELYVESTMSSHWQAWLCYLLRLDARDRPQSAQQALNALKNQSELSHLTNRRVSKPVGSRVRCIKGENSLEIMIPSATPVQKRRACFDAMLTSLFFLLPLLFLILVNLEYLAYILIIFVFLAPFYPKLMTAWQKVIFLCFFAFNFEIHQGSFAYELRISPFEKISISGPVADLISIDTHELQSLAYIGVEAPLSLQTGVQSLSFPRVKIGKDIVGVSAPEVDWLAHELREMLDLPLRSHEAYQSASSHSATVRAETIPASATTQLSRPSMAKCQITKHAQSLSVIAPSETKSETKTDTSSDLGCLLTGCFIICMLVIFGLSGFWLTIVMTGLVILGGVLYKKENRSTPGSTKYRLLLDQEQVELRRLTPLTSIVLNQISISQLSYIQVAYQSQHVSDMGYQVSLCPDDYNVEKIRVGDIALWLSHREAQWIAGELSQYLRLPIKEVEVVVQSSKA